MYAPKNNNKRKNNKYASLFGIHCRLRKMIHFIYSTKIHLTYTFSAGNLKFVM